MNTLWTSCQTSWIFTLLIAIAVIEASSAEDECTWCLDDLDEPVVALQVTTIVNNRGKKKGSPSTQDVGVSAVVTAGLAANETDELGSFQNAEDIGASAAVKAGLTGNETDEPAVTAGLTGNETDEPVVALQLRTIVNNRGKKKGAPSAEYNGASAALTAGPAGTQSAEVEGLARDTTAMSDTKAQRLDGKDTNALPSDAMSFFQLNMMESGSPSAAFVEPESSDLAAPNDVLRRESLSCLRILSLVVAAFFVVMALFLSFWRGCKTRATKSAGAIQWQVDLYPKRIAPPAVTPKFKEAQLQSATTSFAMSLEPILSCGSDDVELHIHEMTGKVTHQASLTRSSEGGGWAKVEILATGDEQSLPYPLFACRPTTSDGAMEDVMHTWLSLLVHEKRGSQVLNHIDQDACVGSGISEAEEVHGPGDQAVRHSVAFPVSTQQRRFEFQDGLGQIVGTLEPGLNGEYALLQQGKLAMHIHVDLKKNEVRVTKDAIELAVASVWRQECCPELVLQSCEDYLQVDTMSDATSADAALSLMCVLAILIFK
jgi:hypothetical protein